MILKQELELYKYSDNFIQVYPDVATIERLRDILDLKEPIYERQEITFNGLSETRDLTFTNVIGFIVYVEVNGIIQLPNNYTATNDTITYTGTLNAGDIISAVIASSEELNVLGTENTLIGLFDTPDEYTGHGNELMYVKPSEDGVDFSVHTIGDIQSLKDDQHSHTNKTILDDITNTGDGTKFLSDDGAYKVIDLSGIPSDTDELPEGSTNLYYTNARVEAVISGKTTDDLTEGSTNKYYSTSLFNTDFGSKTTDDLTEGSSNLYYTDTRVSANSDVVANTAAKHLHSNKSLLDSLISNGDGTGYLANDGSYKTIPDVPSNTDELTEGSVNLYYTDGRVNNVISNTSINALSDVNTTGAGSNQVLQFDGNVWKPASISTGTGDMLKSEYDPNNVDDDAFDYNNFINTPDLSNVAYVNVNNTFTDVQNLLIDKSTGYTSLMIKNDHNLGGVSAGTKLYSLYHEQNVQHTGGDEFARIKLFLEKNDKGHSDPAENFDLKLSINQNLVNDSGWLKIGKNLIELNNYPQNETLHFLRLDLDKLYLNNETVGITEFSTDGTLGGNSDTALPTEKAIKTYIDGKLNDKLRGKEVKTSGNLVVGQYLFIGNLYHSTTADINCALRTPFHEPSFSLKVFHVWNDIKYEFGITHYTAAPAPQFDQLVFTQSAGGEPIGMYLHIASVNEDDSYALHMTASYADGDTEVGDISLNGTLVENISNVKTTIDITAKDFRATNVAPGGDMQKSVYDPNNKEADAFDYNNFINTPTIASNTDDLPEGTTNLYYTDARVANKVGKDETGTTSKVDNLWTGTQAEYDALGGYDDNTLYFIK